MDEFLKIDDVAKQSGLSKRTIRYYEEIELLPAPIRSEGGTRLYRQEHVEFLKRVTVTKEVLGFTLQDLQKFISLTDMVENQRLEYRKVSRPDEQKEKLTEIIKIVDEQLKIIEHKLGQILRVQKELTDLRDRTQHAIEERESEK